MSDKYNGYTNYETWVVNTTRWCDMEYAFVPGRHVLSRPDENDGLIRSWLSRQGLRLPTLVKNGTVWVGDAARANYLTTLMARRWAEVFPQPTVGIWEEVPRG